MKPERALSEAEREELEALLQSRDPGLSSPMRGSVTRLHGFITSIVSGPLVLPSEWIPVVWGDETAGAWANMRDAERATTLLMRFYNETLADLSTGYDRRGILLDCIGEGPDEMYLADDWCMGYVIGIAQRDDEWKEAVDAPEIAAYVSIILELADTTIDSVFDPVKKPAEYAAARDALPDCAFRISQWWRRRLTPTVRRASPKISANDACPCGSGKKYKRCCSPLRVS